MILIVLAIFLITILSVVASTLYVVRQQTVVIIERFGKYQTTSGSGMHVRLPFGIDKIAARIQLRLLQSEIVVETKTKDNVFVTLNVATQYRVNEQMLITNSCVLKLKSNHTSKMLFVHLFQN